MRLLLPLVALLCTAACGRRAHEVPDAFRWEEEVAPGSTIHLRTASGHIEVTPAAGASARIAGSTRWVGRENPIHFAWTREGSDVYVCALSTRGGDCTQDKEPFARSNHSWLDMFSLFKHRPTDVVASLRLSVPAGVKVDARATNGTITLHGVTAGIIALAVNGSINIAGSSGSVEAKGTNANISVALDSLDADDRVVLESINGNMTARLPASLEGNVELSTINGKIRSDFPISTEGDLSRHKLHGQIGTSSREVLLRTVNGNVSLLKQEEASRPAETHPLRGRPVKS